MAYDEFLADRIKAELKRQNVPFEEKKMMGGVCYLVNDKMCVGIVKQKLMARIGTEKYDEAFDKPGCREMDFTGKPLKGYVFVEPDGIDLDSDLAYWVNLALEFNPRAKSSKKRK